MPPRSPLRLIHSIAALGLQSLIVLAFCSTSAHAQLPPKLKRCLPYPTLADEIDQMNEEVRQKLAGDSAPESDSLPELPIGVIDEVQFDGPIHLSDSAKQQIIETLRLHSFYPSSGWIGETQELLIRSAWQDEGFFKVLATANLQLLAEAGSVQHYLIKIHVEEGLQYRLGKVSFRSSDPDVPLVLPAQQLRELVALREGDLFSADKIRQSLDNMKKAYSNLGYVDFVATPVTDIDDSTQTISLIFEFDQEKQYRIGTVEVFGPTPQAEEFLKSRLKPGEIFNQRNLDILLKENDSLLPELIGPEDEAISRDVKNGKLNIRLNFQSCPDSPE